MIRGERMVKGGSRILGALTVSFTHEYIRSRSTIPVSNLHLNHGVNR